MCEQDARNQDKIEGDHSERVRKINEELRIAKARCHKYKEIHAEYEATLASHQVMMLEGGAARAGGVSCGRR